MTRRRSSFRLGRQAKTIHGSRELPPAQGIVFG
jgi:hypothetical protein